jgi:3-methyladenine DNA glycosylase AlkD
MPETLVEELFALQDLTYRDFTARLIPTCPQERIIGIRTPMLRRFSKTFAQDRRHEAFMQTLPHTYYEENNVHADLIGLTCKTFPEAIAALDAFLPYVDNWATCDMLKVSLLKLHPEETLAKIRTWLDAPHTYMVRFGIDVLTDYYLEKLFAPEHLTWVSRIELDDYYVNMARAVYFSFALVKRYDETVALFTTPHMDTWTHNKALQKARESHRIDDQTKAFLQSLKVKG